MEKNRIQKSLEELEQNKIKVTDLIDTNFHKNGYIFPSKILETLMLDYISKRCYKPDSKGDIKTRTSISDYYKESNININPENIIITASSSESYNLLFNNLTNRGDNILLPRPSYPLFEYLADFNGLEVRFYDMVFGNNFEIDINSITNQIDDKTKFIIIISPNNPTGQIISQNNLNSILEICSNKDIMLISDEVFSDFLYTDNVDDPEAPLPQLPRPAGIVSKAVVCTLNGISKMFACPDLKLSWMAFSGHNDKLGQIIDTLEIANDMFLNCNSLSQYILPELFTYGQSFKKKMISQINKNRKILINMLSNNDNIKFINPVGGIHTILKIEGIDNEKSNIRTDEDFVIELLREKHIYVHPGYFYGIDKDMYIVISFIKKSEELEEGLKKLCDFVKEIC